MSNSKNHTGNSKEQSSITENHMTCESAGMFSFVSPQLQLLHSGKVRESFQVDEKHRLLVVTDRISCFDKVLCTPVPDKGAVLNSISAYWFEKTAHICPSHFVRSVDPAASLVREAKPLPVEVIVRGYLTGSAWRGYEEGKREFSGVLLPDGLTRNQAFDKPIITPTTKEEIDREITPGDMVKEGLVTQEQWETMSQLALRLFELGTRELAQRNLLLVDTKYEFGIIDGRISLIDEIHTPDSSRFWYANSYNDAPEKVKALDKEFVRQWLLDHPLPDGSIPDTLPEHVLVEARRRYLDIHRIITGEELYIDSTVDRRCRLARNLCGSGLIRDSYVAIFMGSAADLSYADRIAEALAPFDVYTDKRVISAHKNGEKLVKALDEYNHSAEPGVIIAIAGRSNGLGGALAANTCLPVINCPPFKDLSDYSVNIHSSLQMPSETPALTILSPKAAALAAIRCLNLHRLRDLSLKRIREVKDNLNNDDQRVRRGNAE